MLAIWRARYLRPVDRMTSYSFVTASAKHAALLGKVTPEARVCLRALCAVVWDRKGSGMEEYERQLAALARLGYMPSTMHGVEKPCVLLAADHVVKIGRQVAQEAMVSYAAPRGRMLAVTALLDDEIIVQEKAVKIANRLSVSWEHKCRSFENRCARFGFTDCHTFNYGLFEDGTLKLFDPASWNAESALARWESAGAKTATPSSR